MIFISLENYAVNLLKYVFQWWEFSFAFFFKQTFLNYLFFKTNIYHFYN